MEEKYTIEEIENWIKENDFSDRGNEFKIYWHRVTHKAIQKANQPPENKDQIKLL